MNDEIKILYQQLITSCLYIFVFVVFIFLTYNNILKKTNQTPLFDDNEANLLFLFVNVIAFILILSYFYINYKLYELDNNLPNKLQFFVSILSIIGSLIVIYSIIINNNSNSLNPKF